MKITSHYLMVIISIALLVLSIWYYAIDRQKITAIVVIIWGLLLISTISNITVIYMQKKENK